MNTVNNLLSIVAVTQKPILVSAKKNELSFLSVADVRFHIFFRSLPGAVEIGQSIDQTKLRSCVAALGKAETWHDGKLSNDGDFVFASLRREAIRT